LANTGDDLQHAVKVGAKMIKIYVAAYVILGILALMYTAVAAPSLPQDVARLLSLKASNVTATGNVTANVTSLVKWGVNYLVGFNIADTYAISSVTTAITGIALYLGIRIFSRAAEKVRGRGLGKAPEAILVTSVVAAVTYMALSLWARSSINTAYQAALTATSNIHVLASNKDVIMALKEVAGAVRSLPVVRVAYMSAAILELSKAIAAAAAYVLLGKVLNAPFSRAIATFFIIQGSYDALKEVLILTSHPATSLVMTASGLIFVVTAGRLLLQWANASSVAKTLSEKADSLKSTAT